MHNKFSTIKTTIEQTMQDYNVPGVAVGIYHNQQIWTAGFGVTSLEMPVSVTSKTLFQIASISKTYTSTLIMRLVEAEKLSLDTPIKSYIPELKLKDQATEANLTLRHILTHTAGFAGDTCVFKDFGAGDDALSKMLAELVNVPQDFPLGSLVSYNNAGFSIAGYVIAKVMKQPFEEVMQEWLFKPLGLTNSYFFFKDFFMHSYAVPYDENDDKKLEPVKIWGCGRAANPAGGIVTHVEDMLRYAQFHLKNGTTVSGESVLSPANVQLMQQQQVKMNAEIALGLSWFIEEIDGVKMISHGGGVPGHISYLMLVPAAQTALVMLTSSSSGGKLMEQVKEVFNETYLGLKKKQPDPIQAVTPEQRQAYIGQYANADGMVISEIKQEQDDLIWHFILSGEMLKMANKKKFPPCTMKFVGDDSWYLFEGETRLPFKITSVRDEKGNVVRLNAGRLLTKIS